MPFARYVFRLSYMYIVILFEKWSNGCTFYYGYAGADPENFSRGGPTLSKKKPITHT